LKNDPDFVKVITKARKKEARGEKFVPMNEREIVALIAYMQRLGTDIKVKIILKNKSHVRTNKTQYDD
jgi:cytochrome c oxidase cbb3-type subunit I/II